MPSNITLFTIQNNTGGTIGPYGLNAFTIAASGTYNVQLPINGLLSDTNFFADWAAGNISISTGGVQLLPTSLYNDYFSVLSTSEFSNNSQNITGNSTTTVKSGVGIMHAIIIGNNNTGGTVTVYDNTSATGSPLMTLQLGSPSGGLLSTSGQEGPEYLNMLNIKFNTGLTVVTAGSSNNNITVIYQ